MALFSGVRQRIWVEAGAFVANFDADQIICQPAGDTDHFFVVQPVTVFYGVDNSFFQGKLYAEDFTIVPVGLAELFEHFMDGIAACPGLTGDNVFRSPNPGRLGHGR